MDGLVAFFVNYYNKIKLFLIPFILKLVVNFKFLFKQNPKSHQLGSLLIISLTSYPTRFSTLPLTLKCLLNQSILPDYVILWIAYQDKDQLTPEILKLQKKGLTIAFCEDLRSYKKIIPALQKYPDSFIVTADDDMYYASTWLEEMIGCYKENSENVICHRVHRICLGKDDLPLPYLQWQHKSQITDASPLNFQTGCGGVLYPPKTFHSDVMDINAFKKLCPDADDVWLYWMMRLNGKMARKTNYRFNDYCWNGSQQDALCHSNRSGGNDSKINAMINFYGNVTAD